MALVAPDLALAATRPADAPEVDARTPPLPPEYLVYEGDWATVGYHPSARERVRALLPQLDGMRARLRASLGVAVLETVEIRVAAIALEMAHLSPGDQDGTGRVVAFHDQRLVVVAAEPGARGTDLAALVAHGLAHVALDDATAGRPVPAWIAEGFADDTSGTASNDRLEALATVALRRELPTTDDLARSQGAPWAHRAMSADLVRWLGQRSEGRGVAVFASSVAEGASPDRALEIAAGASLPTIEREHRESLARRFGFAPVILLAALVWLVVATVSLARRARKTRTAPREEVVAAISLAPARARRADRNLVARASREVDVAAVEPGVPKIRRDGGWHTLH